MTENTRHALPSRRRRTRVEISRRGMGVIPVIALFAITVAFTAVWAKSTIGRLRDQQLSEQRVQARWLAEAGVRRAAARRTVDATYTGETWQVAASELARPADAAVEIRIEPAAAAGGRIRIIAVASYPADQPRVRVRKTVLLSAPAEESSP